MTAEKGNKVYTIDESMKDRYQADGYDIKDDEGSVIAHGKGKTVSYDDYIKAVQEIGRLQEQVASQETVLEKKAAGKKAGE